MYTYLIYIYMYTYGGCLKLCYPKTCLSPTFRKSSANLSRISRLQKCL